MASAIALQSACVLCGHDFDFDLPPALLDAVQKSRLVVFAGAGVSTEAPNVFHSSFYDEVFAQLSVKPDEPDFPSVMSAFQSEFGRLKLMEEAITRIGYADTMPSLRVFAARFHRELATISQVRDIITTNWDGFFEDECGALPLVVDGDYAFYNMPQRKVYKIHGSLRNISTIVATTEDYQEAEDRFRTSAIGGTLRHLLATKIVVFVGYSLRDADFRNVYEPLLSGMGQLRPVAYFVSPFSSGEAAELGLRHIKTDGTHFLRSLKKHLVEAKALLPDAVLGRASDLVEVVRKCHNATADMNWRENLGIVFSLAYQDGLLDALNRINSQWKTGEYSVPGRVSDLVHSYSHLLDTAIEKERFWDAAYIDGYMSGLILLLAEDNEINGIPLYEFFDPDMFPTSSLNKEDEVEDQDASTEPDVGDEREEQSDLDNKEDRFLSEAELLGYLEGWEEELPAAAAEARAIVAKLAVGLVPQHTPFLNGVLEGKQAPSI